MTTQATNAAAPATSRSERAAGRRALHSLRMERLDVSAVGRADTQQ